MKRIFCLLSILMFSFVSFVWADYKDDVGYEALTDRLGSSCPDGSGVDVIQVEAYQSGTTNYAPDSTNAEFTGKTFTMKSGDGVSGHATTVGKNFYGNTTSMASGITNIDCYYTGDFMNDALRINSTNGPIDFGAYRVINHSWIGYYANDNYNAQALRRMDDVVDKQGITVVAGVGNENIAMTSASYVNLFSE